jgi:indole-3-glycerol phosphate synthase
MRSEFNPVRLAQIYERHGATCVSVLTDAPYFQGQLLHLSQVRSTVSVPVLRKDFFIDGYQIAEARSAGADAILLIAEILNDVALAQLQDQAHRLGMSVLVEFHDPANVDRVLASGADLIGINNRDLRDFSTDIENTFRLRDRIPPEVVLVSESGIRTRRDVERLQAAGVAAVLVGEQLMRARDVGLALERLLGVAPEGDTKC